MKASEMRVGYGSVLIVGVWTKTCNKIRSRDFHFMEKYLGSHPLAVLLGKPFQKDASQSSPSQNITSPENKQMPTKKASFKKMTGSSSNIFLCDCFFFSVENVRKKNICPQKVVQNGDLQRVASVKNSPPSTTPCLEIVSPKYPWQSKGNPPPRMPRKTPSLIRPT